MDAVYKKMNAEQVRTIRERSDLKIILKGIEKLANQLKENEEEI